MKTSPLLASILLAAVAISTTSCRSTLYRAAEEGDVQAVKDELANGAAPSGKASAGNLSWQIPTAIITLPIDIVRLVNPLGGIVDPGWHKTGELNEQGKPKWAFDFDTLLTKKVCLFSSKTAMDIATEKEHADVITELILAGSQSSDWAKIKAVTEAARKGDAETLRLLMEKGCHEKADWNVKGDYKPLMLAIGNGHEECARILLEYGAKFDSTVTLDNRVVTCYDYAAAKGQITLYTKLGGILAASPASLAGKRITFTHGKGIPIWTIQANGNSYTTPSFAQDNTCKDNAPDIPNSFVYQKTGEKTATINIDGYEVAATYILTFTTPTSGTASCDGGDDNGAFSEQNVLFTIQ